MQVQGIRISDGEEILSVTLADILKLLTHGSSLKWLLLFIDGVPKQEIALSMEKFQAKVNQSCNGISIQWEELFVLSDQFFQMYELVVLASQNANILHRYQTDEEMYNLCEIVIELVDCAFWEVHTKDQDLILKIQKKFKKTEKIFR